MNNECELCCPSKMFTVTEIDPLGTGCDYVHSELIKNEISITSIWWDDLRECRLEANLHFKINYCPRCGRKLEE